jgi:hypothetical protein
MVARTGWVKSSRCVSVVPGEPPRTGQWTAGSSETSTAESVREVRHHSAIVEHLEQRDVRGGGACAEGQVPAGGCEVAADGGEIALAAGGAATGDEREAGVGGRRLEHAERQPELRAELARGRGVQNPDQRLQRVHIEAGDGHDAFEHFPDGVRIDILGCVSVEERGKALRVPRQAAHEDRRQVLGSELKPAGCELRGHRAIELQPDGIRAHRRVAGPGRKLDRHRETRGGVGRAGEQHADERAHRSLRDGLGGIADRDFHATAEQVQADVHRVGRRERTPFQARTGDGGREAERDGGSAFLLVAFKLEPDSAIRGRVREAGERDRINQQAAAAGVAKREAALEVRDAGIRRIGDQLAPRRVPDLDCVGQFQCATVDDGRWRAAEQAQLGPVHGGIVADEQMEAAAGVEAGE